METSHSNPRNAKGRPNRPWAAIIIVFALVVVVANLIGYIVYREKGRSETPTPTTVASTDSAEDPEESTVSELAKEQRENGVKALRAGAYDRAIASFDAALRLDPKIKDVATLREVAERLKVSTPADEPSEEVKDEPKRSEVVARAPSPRRTRTERSPPPSRPQPSRRSRASRSPPPPPPPPPEPEPVEVAARIEAPPPQEPPVVEPPPPPVADMSGDERLDLVALVDRDSPKEPDVEAIVESPRSSGSTLKPTPTSATPRLVVFWPGRSSTSLSRALAAQMQNVDVRVYSRTSALSRALEEGADALMASPSLLRSKGLSPNITGTGGSDGDYVAASLTSGLTTSRLSGVTVGVVDELGRKGMPALVAKLIGGSAPKLRRVTKVEDLLPLLQFDIAQAIIVRKSDLASLAARTQQKLYTLPLTAHREPLAVAFVAGGRKAIVERAVRGMNADAKQKLGVDSWR